MRPVGMLGFSHTTGGTMKRKRFSEEQIMRILHEAETLENVREVSRTISQRRRCISGVDSLGPGCLRGQAPPDSGVGERRVEADRG